MNLPLYILDIDESTEGETLVFAVGLVSQPAIERNWMAFAANEPTKFTIVDEEKMILAGPLMAADQPIFRRDELGKEFYCAFPAESIYKIVSKYTRSGKPLSFNINHDDSAPVHGAFLHQHFIIDSKKGINTPTGFDLLPDGSWFGLVKIDDRKVWDEQIKTGNLKGFSVEGYFNDIKLLEAPQNIYENLKEQILSCLN